MGNYNMMMECLPDDLLFEIIVHLPAEDVYKVARLVCWKWYRTIYTHYFMYAHFQRAPSGLLFISEDSHPIFMTVRQTGQIEISKLSYVLRRPSYLHFSGSNGLLVERNLIKRKLLYISNPATNQIFVLPPFSGKLYFHLSFGMAYVATSMEYKAVIVNQDNVNERHQCRILTVGVDNSWRNMRTQELPYMTRFNFAYPPLVNGGFMHWAMDNAWPPIDHPVLTMNLETETITLTPSPIFIGDKCSRTFLPTGKYLSLLIMHKESLCKIWEMKPESGEWRKLSDFTIDVGQYCREPRPIGWLKYPELLVFFVWRERSCNVIVYNLITKEVKAISTPNVHYAFKAIVHKNSLAFVG